MAAITIDSPRWRDGWGEPLSAPRPPAPALRLVDSGARRPDARVLRRRRLVVAVVLTALVVLGLALLARIAGAPGVAGSAPEGRVTHVVEPGETYWSIAADHTDRGDLRIAVDALVDANGGRPLVAGDRIELRP